MRRPALYGLALVAALSTAGCGSRSHAAASGLAATCAHGRAQLRSVAAVDNLGDAKRALQVVISLETRLLAEGRARGVLATQLRLSIAAAQRSLAAIDGDAQGSMDPVRTGVPAARRAVAGARLLLDGVCGARRD